MTKWREEENYKLCTKEKQLKVILMKENGQKKTSKERKQRNKNGTHAT